MKDVDLAKPTFILDDIDNDDLCEYCIGIEWMDGLTVNKENAISVLGYNLGITQHVVCKINDKKILFIQQKFDVQFLF